MRERGTVIWLIGGIGMRVLVVGSGGREHALCWAIGASPLCDKLYCAPGNAGIAAEAECVAVAAEGIDGIVRLEEAAIKTFGPSAAAAALEGSKGFTKDFCARHNIPTGAYRRFKQRDA